LKKLVFVIVTPALFLLSLTLPYAIIEIKKINSYSPKVISDLAFLMQKTDWHKYEKNHPPRMRGRR